MKWLTVSLVCFVLAGCLQTIKQTNQSLAPISGKGSSQSGNAYRGSPNSAILSPEQNDKLMSALSVRQRDENLNRAVSEATPIISTVTKLFACYKGNMPPQSMTSRYSASGSGIFAMSPMESMRYHDQSTCLSVLRFQNWAMPAKNALKYQVVYVSDSSGESSTKEHTLVKQASGEWLYQ